MYLRITKRTNRDGSVVEYFQLAHNERHPDTRKPVAKIIHNFGRVDQLDRQELVRLCQSIGRVCGLRFDDPLVVTRDLAVPVGLSIDMKITRTLDLGCPLVIEALWERLGLKKCLEAIKQAASGSIPLERALLAMVANRLCMPESRFGDWDRWLSTVYLPSCWDLKLQHMYGAIDLLHANIDEVEKTIFLNMANLFNLEIDLIFYDTTTALFHVDCEDDDIDFNTTQRTIGDIKEGNLASKMVVVLAVTRDGIPVRSWVLPGNLSDTTIVAKVRADLEGWNLGRAMFVAAPGMNSKGNQAELTKVCGKYLWACRLANITEIEREILGKRGSYTTFKDNIQAKEVIISDGARRRRYILCYNHGEAERQAKHRQVIIELLESELAGHEDHSADVQWAIELLASRRFKRYLRTTEGGQLHVDHGAIVDAAKYDGKWVVETNDDSTSLEEAACGYKNLMAIERFFYSLRHTQVKMTPVCHSTSRLIEAYVKICVLALQVERVAEIACGMPWNHIKGVLEALQVTEFFDLKYRVLMRNEVTEETEKIFESLNIIPPMRVVHVSEQGQNS